MNDVKESTPPPTGLVREPGIAFTGIRDLGRLPNMSSTARSSPSGTSARARAVSHTDPADVSLKTALEALADPVRRSILQQLAESADWTRACGTFNLAVGKATGSHHFAVLRNAGLIEQRDEGSRRLNRLRAKEFEKRFPGLLTLALQES
jgi:DNA-binding transcriptional ArsR family regulator